MNKRTATSYLKQWQRGDKSKQAIEFELGVTTAKGKFITRTWTNVLGVDTNTGSRTRRTTSVVAGV